MLSAILSALHLLALSVGLPAVALRGRALGGALRGTLGEPGFERLFLADNLWGLAAVAWIATGTLRAFGGLEKGTSFYLHSSLFWVKMALVAAVLVLETAPMATLIRWRVERRRGHAPDTSRARALYLVNHIQLALVVVIVFVASFMARGFGLGR